VERGNPVTQNHDTNTVLKAFRQLDFRVVVEQFFTDTALEADIVLPAKNMFEQTDIIGSYWNPYVQLRQKVVEPAGEVKPETEIYYLLGLRLGFTTEQLDRLLIPMGDLAVEQFLNHKLSRFPGLTLESLRNGPVLAPGLQEIAFADYRFATPSGKIELYSQQAHRLWGVNPLPTYDPVKEFREKTFPLYMMSPTSKNRIHSQFGNLKVIKMVSGKPVLCINPVDARERNISNGDRVRVFNQRGSVEIEVEVTQQVRPGCVSIPNGWWRAQGGAVNLLSAGRETDMGHGSAFHDNLVEVKRI
jgi:anaerobic selenocysteine-containing dehydrogenase